MKRIIIIGIIVVGIIMSLGLQASTMQKNLAVNIPITSQPQQLLPLSIAAMRSRYYPGSDIKIEETLSAGSNYQRYLTSYLSDGYKIYALLTVPNGEKSANGWPVILFNHGYIPPEVYRTTERYIAYTDAFSRNGYIVFKPDYRGNGLSEGNPEGAYYSPAYTVDDLNALASMKKYLQANPEKIGLWGHSMGGNITLRDIVIRPNDIKAAVIWGGVVGSYDDLTNKWQRAVPYRPSTRELALRNSGRQNLISKYGSPSANLTFWNTIDPTAFVSDIAVPVQLHHGLADEEVPVSFSQHLEEKMKASGKTVELFTYEGADHNISSSFEVAMQRSVEFFDKYLK